MVVPFVRRSRRVVLVVTLLVAGLAAAGATSGGQTAAPPPIALAVDVAKPGAKIDRNLFGQFAEHLGKGIYEGVWVGPDSPIPNTRGIRNDVVAALKALKVPNVRWPGGCFADEYHWRKGIGPAGSRAATLNPNWGGVIEPNTFGTHEFMDFVDQIGAEIVGAFLVSDPPLKQVVSRTVEVGLRGGKELNIGTLGWKLGGFRSNNRDDILAIPSPALQGFGYFQNVGSTRRQGIEAQVSLTSKALQLHASYALVDARFLDTLQVGSHSPFADINGNVQILPGNRIPAIPRNRNQGRYRLFDHRCIQGWRRCAVRRQPVFRG